jgi:hypothetical protein
MVGALGVDAHEPRVKVILIGAWSRAIMPLMRDYSTGGPISSPPLFFFFLSILAWA